MQNSKFWPGYITGFVSCFVLIFFLFCAYYIGKTVLNTLRPPVVTEKVTEKKVEKNTQQNYQQQDNQQQDNTPKNQSAGTQYGVKLNNSIFPLSTSMTGLYGVCTINGRLRAYIASSIEDKYRKQHPNDTTFFRGTFTNWENVEAQRDGQYTFVDGDFITNSNPKPNESQAYEWCVQFWPKTGHWPHLGINDKTLTASSVGIYKFIDNGYAGYNVNYEIVPLL